MIYTVVVDRVTTYAVEAENAEQAADKALSDEARVIDDETAGHRVYDAASNFVPTKGGESE